MVSNMSSSQHSFFEALKKSNRFPSSGKPSKKVYFQVYFNSTGANLLTVDSKGTELRTDYRNYSGAERNLLKTLEHLKDQTKIGFDKKRQTRGTSISENGFLIWNLRQQPNLVNEEMQSIEFSEQVGELVLIIEGDTQLECKFALKLGDEVHQEIRLINENHVYFNRIIYEVNTAVTDYATLASFQTLIFPSDLEKYLNLFFSYCDHVDLQYDDYQTVLEAPTKAESSLIFEKIAADNSLYLRISNNAPGIEPKFIDTYGVTKIVSLDGPRKLIKISDLILNDIEEIASKTAKVLNDLSKDELSGDAGFYQDENFFIIEDPLSERFIQAIIPDLAKNHSVYGAENLEAYNVKLVKPELNLSIDHGIDFLEGDASLSIGGEQFSLFEALYQFKTNSYIKLSDGNKAVLDNDYVEKLERIFQKKDEGVSVSFFDLPLVQDLIDDRTNADTYQGRYEVFKGLLDLPKRETELPKIEAELRPYQVEGFKWLKYLHDNRLGGCLADDMGLGKTLQAISLLAAIYPFESKPTLIIIPKSLIFNWQNEFQKFVPSLNVSLYYGTDRDIDSCMTHHVIISTYGTVRNDIEILKDKEFHCILLDESQTIKNHESQISRAVSILHADVRFALSGTPIENNLGELYSLFRFIAPGMFGGLAKFNRHYLFPIQQNINREVAGDLKKKIYPFILRRLKKDVLHDLPEKVEKVLYVEMSPEQQKFYEQRRTFFHETIRLRVLSEGIKQSQFFILQAITVLRQIASIPEVKSDGQILSPKRELLLENMNEAIANDHKILLFSNFLGILEYLAEDLKARNIGYETLTGATRDRETPVKNFQSNPDCKIFLMTLKTGGQGLNLTAADMVYIFDPWWNLAAENQATDRSHRLGQDKTVFTYKLIAKGTIEEKMLALQNRKKALFENIISDESMSFKFLNEDDIDYLIG